MPDEIILMIGLRRIKAAQSLDARDDRSGKNMTRAKLGDVFTNNFRLRLVRDKNCRTVLGSRIRPLTIALGGIMLMSAKFHIPETVTGLIGAVLIGLSLWWSVRHKRKFPDGEIENAVRAD